MYQTILGVILGAVAYFGITVTTVPEPHAKALAVLESTAIQLNNNCSGTVVDKKRRLVLTAFHCIQGYKKDFYHNIERVVYNEDGTEKVRFTHLAKVIRTHSAEDIAVLEIVTGVTLPEEAKLSAKKLKRGDTIYAMGNPFGWEYLFSYGVVLDPYFVAGTDFPGPLQGKDYIAVDHTSFHGSSGSAIVNGSGEIVGIHTLGNGAGFRWAVPVHKAAKLLSFI